VDNITAVLAIAAKGTAIVSNKLPNHGIKYATISTIVAIPNGMMAEELPYINNCQELILLEQSPGLWPY